ncbi:MAG: hypothetical protein IJX98_04960 [Clostridia bacterium]|nr:hypothetical protein [Clostridia bacterium]
MENCVKAMLYCYPRLESITDGYLQHIKNKAALSYDGKTPTWELAEYLAGEVLNKQRVQELKLLLDNALKNLTVEEKLLLDVRYFGKLDQVRRLFAAKAASLADDYMREIKIWSERTYFRKQARLLKKIIRRLSAAELDKQSFLEKFASLDGVSAVYQYIELGKDIGMERKEREFLAFLNRIRN